MTLRNEIDEMRQHQIRSEDKGEAIITFSVKEFGHLLNFHDKAVDALDYAQGAQEYQIAECRRQAREVLALLDKETS